MLPLKMLLEYNFLSGAKLATVYELEKGVKIIGFAEKDLFEIKVLTIGKNPKRKGFGKKALEFLRPRFKKITVSEIYPGALPFWRKMCACGLVDELLSIKDGSNFYPLSGPVPFPDLEQGGETAGDNNCIIHEI